MAKQYIHGTYGKLGATQYRAPVLSAGIPVYVGTAPVQLTENYALAVNTPLLIRNLDEARNAIGYSEDFSKYTLCEAVSAHFIEPANPVGPIILINVLDPDAVKGTTQKTQTAAVNGGEAVLTDMEEAILSGLEIDGKALGVDYALTYVENTKGVIVRELNKGGLGATITAKYYEVDPDLVTDETVIGTVNEIGQKTGLEALADVYEKTGVIPNVLLAPGFSTSPDVFLKMIEMSDSLNGQWQMYVFPDIPLMDGATPITVKTVAQWKKDNGYDSERATPAWPMVRAVSTKIYHMSTVAEVIKQQLESAVSNGVPYQTPSNKDGFPIAGLYMGEAYEGILYDREAINAYANEHGIRSACYTGGRYVLWGAHTGAYEFDAENDLRNVFETNMFMLFYVLNWFQTNFGDEIDSQMTKNGAQSIALTTQSYLDGLVGAGMLLYGQCEFRDAEHTPTDYVNGDFKFNIATTPAPLAKSLTAYVAYSEEGMRLYFENE